MSRREIVIQSVTNGFLVGEPTNPDGPTYCADVESVQQHVGEILTAPRRAGASAGWRPVDESPIDAMARDLGIPANVVRASMREAMSQGGDALMDEIRRKQAEAEVPDESEEPTS